MAKVDDRTTDDSELGKTRLFDEYEDEMELEKGEKEPDEAEDKKGQEAAINELKNDTKLQQIFTSVEFEAQDFDREDLENPDQFARFVLEKTPDLKGRLDQIPAAEKAGLMSKINDYIQKNVHSRWQKEGEMKEKEMGKEMDKKLSLRKEDVENDDFHSQEIFTREMSDRAAELTRGFSGKLKKKMDGYSAKKIDDQFREWKIQHENLHQQELKEAREGVDKLLVITAEDAENDEFHKPENFNKHMNEKVEKVIEDLPDDLKAEIEAYKDKKIRELFPQWEIKHEAAEEKKISEELLKTISSASIPQEMAGRHLESDEFIPEYWEHILKNIDPEIQHDLQEHPALIQKIFGKNEVKTALSRKFETYEVEHDKAMEKKFSEDLVKNISNTLMTPEMILKHQTPDEFKENFYQNLIQNARGEFAEELKEHPGLKDKLFKNTNVESALSDKAKEYDEKHDKSMENKFSGELSELIKSGEISDKLAAEHLEPEEFRHRYFEEIMQHVSPELREELKEHDDLKEKLFGNKTVETSLSDKYKEYGEKHDDSMEKRFSAELSELIHSGEISAEFALSHLEPEEFQEKYFELILKKASPELREELREHEGLQETLFGNKDVNDSLTEKYKEYDEKHDSAMEKEYSGELSTLISSEKISPEMALKHLEPAEFKDKFFEKILAKASPELRKELLEHKGLTDKLQKNSAVESALSDKAKEYEEKHDTAMEKEFSGELGKLLANKIPDEFAQKHYNSDTFPKKYFAEMLKKASPEFKEELGEHADLKEKLFENKDVQKGLASSFEKYEKEHDKAMEKKFSEEIVASIILAKNPQSKSESKFSQKDFIKQLYANIIKSGSKDLKEELSEHKRLESKLFSHKEVQQELRSKFKAYDKGREEDKKDPLDNLREQLSLLGKEKKISAELTDLDTADEWSDEQLDKVMGQLDPEMKKVFFSYLKIQKISKKEEAEEKGLEKNISQEKGGKKKLKPEDFSNLKDSEITGKLGEMLDIDVGRERLQSLKKIPVMRNMLAKAHLKNSLEPFIAEWSSQMKESDMKLFRLSLTKPGTTNQEALMGMFNSIAGRKASTRIKKFSPETWKKFNLGLKYLDLKTADLLPSSEKKEEEKELEPDTEDERDFLLEEEPETEEEEELQETEETEELTEEELARLEEEAKEAEEGTLEEDKKEESDEDAEKNEQDKEESEQDSEEISEQEEAHPAQPDKTNFAEVENKESYQQPLQAEKKTEAPENKEKDVLKTDSVDNKPKVEMKDLPVDNKQIDEIKSRAPDAAKQIQPEKNIQRDKSAPKGGIPPFQSEWKKDQRTEQVATVQPKNNLEKKKITDPLMELERFRRELMDSLKKTAKTGSALDKEFEADFGVPFEIPQEEKSEFLETLRLEMETHSMSLKSLLQKFVIYIRFVNDNDIPVKINLPSELLERLVVKPGEIFRSLNEFYFNCREHHEKQPRFSFSTPDHVRLSDISFKLHFQVHEGDNCLAKINCPLVEEREITSKVAA